GEGMFGDPKTSDPSLVYDDVECPNPATPGADLRGVNGGGFAPDELVVLHQDGKWGRELGRVTTDGAGSFSNLTLTLPNDITGGDHQIWGVGQSSGIASPGTFTGLSQGARSPATLAAGDPTTFSGNGFVPGDPVSLTFADGSGKQIVANGSGVVTANLVSPKVAGPHSAVVVSGVNGSFNAGFNVTPLATLPDQ